MLLRSRSHTPTYICQSYTGNAHKHAFPSTKMFYSYTGRKHKKSLSRNNCSKFLKILSQYFLVTEGRCLAMQNNSIEKKREEKKDKCPIN